MADDLDATMENLRKSSKGLNENMEAAKHNFLLRGYFKKKERAKRKAAELGGRIYKGEIRPRPYRNKKGTACDYCPFADVCGFDVKLPGYEYQSFQSLSVEEVLEKIREEGE